MSVWLSEFQRYGLLDKIPPKIICSRKNTSAYIYFLNNLRNIKKETDKSGGKKSEAKFGDESIIW